MRNRSFASLLVVGLLATGTISVSATSPAAAASQASVFAFGHASFHGSPGVKSLSHPIVGMASTPSGRGYWLVASDGGMFSFGDARFHGSTGGMSLNEPIVGMASTPSGRGYWLVASDGGMFSFGDARFYGAVTAGAINRPIVGMASTPSGHGYRLVSADGRVFSFGDATNGGRAHPSSVRAPRLGDASIVGIATSGQSRGYWLAAAGGAGAKAEAAIAWFDSRIGSGAYEGLCETAVELAYKTLNQYPSARTDWLAQPVKHFDWQNAPRGALVFYATSSDGHVAISLGRGQVISTSISHRIGVAPVGFLQNPLGWAPAPW